MTDLLKIPKPRYYGKDEDGEPIISIIGSYILWKELLPEVYGIEFNEYRGGESCDICNGQQWINTYEYGFIRCICNVSYWMDVYRIENKKFRSPASEKSLDTLELWGNNDQKKMLGTVLHEVKMWTRNPSRWMVFQGSVGTGKTHIMLGINSLFFPMSLYITAGDLETMVFQYLQEQQLDVLVDALSSIPILLLDDLTSDYGQDFFRATLRKIIDARYRQWQEFPVVVATNMQNGRLRSDYDPRIGDRLTDNGISDVFNINMPSWRQRNAY